MAAIGFHQEVELKQKPCMHFRIGAMLCPADDWKAPELGEKLSGNWSHGGRGTFIIHPSHPQARCSFHFGNCCVGANGHTSVDAISNLDAILRDLRDPTTSFSKSLVHSGVLVTCVEWVGGDWPANFEEFMSRGKLERMATYLRGRGIDAAFNFNDSQVVQIEAVKRADGAGFVARQQNGRVHEARMHVACVLESVSGMVRNLEAFIASTNAVLQQFVSQDVDSEDEDDDPE